VSKEKALETRDYINYLLVTGLVAVSGFPYFYRTQAFILILLLIAFFFYLKESIRFDFRVLKIIGLFFIVEMSQVLLVKPFDPILLAGTYTRLFVGFVIISLCRENFIKYYVNILYILCIISFIFFLPCFFFHGIYDFFVNSVCPHFNPPGQNIIEFYKPEPTIMFFTFDEAILEFRNPGPFWEQGAFAIFILIAMLFNLMQEKTLWSKKNIVFTLAVVSTLSTSGVIALALLIVFFYMVTQNLVRRLIFIAIALPVMVSMYFSLEFLNSKIENNIKISGYDNSSRFGSALSDLKDFSTNPIIGWGRGAMRYGGAKFTFFSHEQHRNCGLTAVLATYGIFVFIYFFYNYYKTLKTVCIANHFNPKFAGYSFIVIWVLGFSQTVFQYPFFYSLMFVHLVYNTRCSDTTT
jgi:hypothetical protein